MFDLVGNPENQFSRVAVYMSIYVICLSLLMNGFFLPPVCIFRIRDVTLALLEHNAPSIILYINLFDMFVII